MIGGAYREMVCEAVAKKSHVTLRELAAMLATAGLRLHQASAPFLQGLQGAMCF